MDKINDTSRHISFFWRSHRSRRERPQKMRFGGETPGASAAPPLKKKRFLAIFGRRICHCALKLCGKNAELNSLSIPHGFSPVRRFYRKIWQKSFWVCFFIIIHWRKKRNLSVRLSGQKCIFGTTFTTEGPFMTYRSSYFSRGGRQFRPHS